MDWEARVDLSRLTIAEYRQTLAPGSTIEQDDAVLCKALNITPEEFAQLSVLEYKRAWKALFKQAQEPLQDPN